MLQWDGEESPWHSPPELLSCISWCSTVSMHQPWLDLAHVRETAKEASLHVHLPHCQNCLTVLLTHCMVRSCGTCTPRCAPCCRNPWGVGGRWPCQHNSIPVVPSSQTSLHSLGVSGRGGDSPFLMTAQMSTGCPQERGCAYGIILPGCYLHTRSVRTPQHESFGLQGRSGFPK